MESEYDEYDGSIMESRYDGEYNGEYDGEYDEYL